MTYRRVTVAGRRVAEHRLVYERENGPIPAGFVVHHLDHDPLNNDPSNLVALSRGDHTRLHLAKYPRSKPCVVCGAMFTPPATNRRRARACSQACVSQLVREAAGRREERRRKEREA